MPSTTQTQTQNGKMTDRRQSQSTRNQESTVWPDHRDSGRKDPVQDDPSRRGLEQNVRSSVLEHDDV